MNTTIDVELVDNVIKTWIEAKLLVMTGYSVSTYYIAIQLMLFHLQSCLSLC